MIFIVQHGNVGFMHIEFFFGGRIPPFLTDLPFNYFCLRICYKYLYLVLSVHVVLFLLSITIKDDATHSGKFFLKIIVKKLFLLKKCKTKKIWKKTLKKLINRYNKKI